MSESRGAASVTLDTIIADVIASTRAKNAYWMDAELARAVTDALLAKGLVDYVGPDTFDQVFVLRIPGPSS